MYWSVSGDSTWGTRHMSGNWAMKTPDTDSAILGLAVKYRLVWEMFSNGSEGEHGGVPTLDLKRSDLLGAGEVWIGIWKVKEQTEPVEGKRKLF